MRVCVVIAVICVTALSGEEPIPPVKAKSGEAFIDSIGVNVQLASDRAPYANYQQLVKPKLLELGMRHIRDTTTLDRKDQIGRLKELGKAGIKCHLVLKPADAVGVCKLLLGAVESIEGPDEPDRGPENWPDVARTAQKALFKAMKADASTKNIPVMSPGMHNPLTSYKKLGSLADCAEFGTLHVFPWGENPGAGGFGISLRELAVEARHTCENTAIFITEAGYHNKADQAERAGVPEAAAAKYIPRQMLYLFSQGYIRTHVFELFDSEADPRMSAAEKHFGLVRADGTPKPAFMAVKKLVALLKESGSTGQPESLPYKFRGNHPDIQHVLFQRKDGTFWLLLWQEVPCYDAKTRGEIPVPPEELTFYVGVPLAKATSSYPLRDGDKPQPLNLEKLHVQVTDEIMLIEMVRK